MGEVEKTILYGIATLNYVSQELTRSLVVPTASESKFRNALLKLGYSFPK